MTATAMTHSPSATSPSITRSIHWADCIIGASPTASNRLRCSANCTSRYSTNRRHGTPTAPARRYQHRDSLIPWLRAPSLCSTPAVGFALNAKGHHRLASPNSLPFPQPSPLNQPCNPAPMSQGVNIRSKGSPCPKNFAGIRCLWR